MATSSQSSPIGAEQFAELAIVRLQSVVGTDNGILLPGAVGTVVYRHAGGEAYEVEFLEPLPGVITLRGSDLSLVE